MEIEHSKVLYRLAVAVKALSVDRVGALPLLREAAATLWAADTSCRRRSIAELERQVKQPLEQWLPSGVCANFTGTLSAGGAPTPTCEEIILELNPAAGWERTQHLIALVRDGCRLLQGGQDLYIRFRSYLIEHPTSSISSEIQDILLPLGLSAREFYQGIPSHLIDRTKIYPCPTCGWPMSINANPIQCGSYWCRERSGLHEWRHKDVISNATGKPIKGMVAEGLCMLIAPIWKFSLIPGLFEMAIIERLHRLGYRATLWPDFDSADVELIHQNDIIWIDAKVWSSPHRLAQHLCETEVGKPCIILIPDSHASDLDFLRRHAPARYYRIETEQSFFASLK